MRCLEMILWRLGLFLMLQIRLELDEISSSLTEIAVPHPFLPFPSRE